MAVQAEKRGVLGMLGLLDNTPILEEIAADLQLPDLEGLDGPQLYVRITTHLLSPEFAALEDEGMAPLLAIRDKLRQALGLGAGVAPLAMIQPGDEGLEGFPNGNDGGPDVRRRDARPKREEDSDSSIDEEEEEEEDDDDDEEKDEFQDALDNMEKVREAQEKARRKLEKATRDAKAAGLRVNALGAAGVGGMAAAYGGYPGAAAHGGFPGAGGAGLGLVGKFRGLKFDGMIGKPGEKKS